MIDTDDYEGHTQGPWVLYHRAGGKPTIAGKLSEVDWELIAAAPDLLAEVKRLREAFITAVRHVGEHDLSRDDLFSKLDDDLVSLWLFRNE